MTRPKKDESIRRTKNVMVRFTDVEYALVSCSAEQAGYPVAVYVRKQAITEKLHVHYNIVADIAELRDFARQLSHIGNNLNQIAAFFNSGGIQSRAMLEEINRCMTDLRAMRKEIAGLPLAVFKILFLDHIALTLCCIVGIVSTAVMDTHQ